MTKEKLLSIMLGCYRKGQNHGVTFATEGTSEMYLQEWLEFNDYMEEELSKLEIEEWPCHTATTKLCPYNKLNNSKNPLQSTTLLLDLRHENRR